MRCAGCGQEVIGEYEIVVRPIVPRGKRRTCDATEDQEPEKVDYAVWDADKDDGGEHPVGGFLVMRRGVDWEEVDHATSRTESDYSLVVDVPAEIRSWVSEKTRELRRSLVLWGRRYGRGWRRLARFGVIEDHKASGLDAQERSLRDLKRSLRDLTSRVEDLEART